MNRSSFQKVYSTIRYTRTLLNAFLAASLLLGLIPPPLASHVATHTADLTGFENLSGLGDELAEAIAYALPKPAVAEAAPMDAPSNALLFAAGEIDGTVFRDYDANATNDSTEPGIENVTVTAYDANGNSASTTTDASGAYTIVAANGGPAALSGEVRIEFTLPTDGSLDFLYPGTAGDGSPTTVQFADIDAGATVNASFNNPADYCGNNPFNLSSCFVGGDHSTATGLGAVVRWERGDGTLAESGRNEYLAYVDQVGALAGLAYQSEHNLVYAGAFAKRHADWGPGADATPDTGDESGAIYVMLNTSIPSTGNNIQTVFTIPDAGNTPRAVDGPTLVNGGGNCTTATTGTDWVRDSCFFDRVGKEGLGDVELSHDQQWLWTINLNNRHLYLIDVANPASGSYGTIYDKGELTDPGCAGGGAVTGDRSRSNIMMESCLWVVSAQEKRTTRTHHGTQVRRQTQSWTILPRSAPTFYGLMTPPIRGVQRPAPPKSSRTAIWISIVVNHGMA